MFYDSRIISNILGIDCGECAVITQDMGMGENASAEDYFKGLLADTGYQPLTNYYTELYRASEDGTIETRYRELLCEAETDYRKLTELVLCLNWLDWYYYDINEYCKSKEMRKHWEDADNYAFEILHGDELSYFIQTLD